MSQIQEADFVHESHAHVCHAAFRNAAPSKLKHNFCKTFYAPCKDASMSTLMRKVIANGVCNISKQPRLRGNTTEVQRAQSELCSAKLATEKRQSKIAVDALSIVTMWLRDL